MKNNCVATSQVSLTLSYNLWQLFHFIVDPDERVRSRDRLPCRSDAASAERTGQIIT